MTHVQPSFRIRHPILTNRQLNVFTVTNTVDKPLIGHTNNKMVWYYPSIVTFWVFGPSQIPCGAAMPGVRFLLKRHFLYASLLFRYIWKLDLQWIGMTLRFTFVFVGFYDVCVFISFTLTLLFSFVMLSVFSM